MDISFFSPLVLAGIWGATLSSALGILTALKHRLEKTSERSVGWLTHLLYLRTVPGRVPAGNSSEQQKSKPANPFIEMVEAATPKPEIVTALPFYYRHLFLEKPSITKEFWIGRKLQLKQSEKAIKRFQEGRSGGLAIIGNPGSGKSALSLFLANSMFDRQNVFFLPALEQGTSDLHQFEHSCKTHFKTRQNLDRFVLQLPPGSTIIIDDLAHWWTRGEDGFKILDQIIGLIDQYGDRCFFIVNLNTHVFNFIDRITGIGNYFLDTVHCPPFSIQELIRIIMLRHRSTGLQFEYNGRKEDSLNQLQLARLFTGILKSCDGSVGLALAQWIKSITAVSREGISINMPAAVNLHPLTHLNTDQRVLLAQFMLHGGLSHTSLQNIMQQDPEALQLELIVLKRFGLLLKTAKGVYQVNPCRYPFREVVLSPILQIDWHELP